MLLFLQQATRSHAVASYRLNRSSSGSYSLFFDLRCLALNAARACSYVLAFRTPLMAVELIQDAGMQVCFKLALNIHHSQHPGPSRSQEISDHST